MPGSKFFQVGQVRSGGNTPFFILGPCVIESEHFVQKLARDLKEICQTLDVPWIFKASYDKANRTSSKSYRGIGLKSGCRILREIGKELSVPVTTDVHSVEEAEIASDFVDVLQIPAFLCRQTDLIQAAAVTGKPVNVKKGQFLAPWDVANIAEKLESAGCQNYVFTERGVTFGYNNLVADMRSLYWIRRQGYPVIFDATHSVQRPGSTGTSTGGDGELAPVLARSAVAAGCDGIFVETHPNPAEALSDGPNQIPLSNLPQLLSQLKKIHEVVR
jgi:2-dehydro-3-deoxyphosphooctonate aldolase (KDO 8-P synthase)